MSPRPDRKPWAFLAVGQERLEDVLADMRAAGCGWLKLDIEEDGMLAVTLRETRIVRALSDRLRPNARVRAGLVWRAYRAWRAQRRAS